MELLAALIIFSLVMLGMAIGVIVKKRPLAGSCGGLNNIEGLGNGRCDVCGASAEEKQKCAKKRSQMDA